MKNIEKILEEKLQARKDAGLYRELKEYSHLIDFSSNDYLGFAKEIETREVESGSTGSRLISGNFSEIEKLEKFIAEYHGYPAALIFNSGYTANLGLLSTLPQRGDTILYDELIHASIRDGIRLSNADSFSFNHNNLDSLKSKLDKAHGNIFVIVESVYSMDGDSPELEELVRICKTYQAVLLVDEAHALGIVGEKGEGLIGLKDLQKDVFAEVVTFGKALGCHGAAILCDQSVKEYLINFCRPFIYTTAPSPQTVNTIKSHYLKLAGKRELQTEIQYLKQSFIEQIGDGYELVTGNYGSIVSVVIPGNDNVKNVAKKLEEKGFFVKPILSPTVPKGKERLRFCFHSYNTLAQVKELTQTLKAIND